MGSGPGVLVVVATPIGNLGDLSPRAQAALTDADLVACEDTRRTGRLLELVGIGSRPLVVVNDHTEADMVPVIVDAVRAGRRVAVVTDAGTPGISDPGQRMVAAVAADGGRIEVIPGPAAPVAALVASGLPATRFVMEGFLPRRGPERAERLGVLAREVRTVVLLEAPHRLAATIGDLARVCGDERRVALCRELTKMHEEVWRGTLGEAVAYTAEVSPRGEFVIVIDGAPPPPAPGDDELLGALAEHEAAGVSRRDAIAAVARASGVSRRRVYQLAIGEDHSPQQDQQDQQDQ